MKKVKKVAAIQQESRQTFDKQLREKKLKEQEPVTQEPAHPTEDGVHECGEGQHWDAEKQICVSDEVPEEHVTTPAPPATKIATEQEGIQCPEGFVPDESGFKCIPKTEPDVVPAETPPVNAPPGAPEPALPHTAADIQAPVIEQEEPVIEPTHPTEDKIPDCPAGSHYDEVSQTCIPDELPEVNITEPPMEPVKVMEIALPAMLKLGEPFADYSDFADCVAKNKGKSDDPEAYCASIKQKAEGESAKEMYHPQRPYIRDMQIAGSVNKLTEAVAKMAREEPERLNKFTKTLKEWNTWYSKHLKKIEETIMLESKLRSRDFAKTQKLIENAVKQISKVVGDVSSLRVFNTTKLTELATAHGRLAQEMNGKTKTFEQILALADKNNVDLKKHIKTLEDRVKEQEEKPEPEPCPEGQHRDESGKCVPDEPTAETKELQKTVEMLQTDMSNLKDKLKGQFKGVTPVKSEDGSRKFVRDPMREGKKAGK